MAMLYSNTNSRLDSIDSKAIEWLRFPLACLIVLWHSQLVGAEYKPVVASNGFAFILKILLSGGICRIAVPAFFLISGYLFFLNLEQWDTATWLGKIKRRFHTLFIPYIIWNILGIVYLCISPYLGAVTDRPDSLLSIFQERGWIRMFWDSNRVMEQWSRPAVNILGITMHNGMPANTPLWFVRDLIVIHLLSPVLYAVLKNTKQFGIGLLAVLFVLNIWLPMEGFSITGVCFYAIGAYLSIYSKGLVSSFRKLKNASYIGSIALLILLVITFGRHGSAQYIQRLFQLTGVIAAFNLADRFIRKENPICTRFADSSFFIYAAHAFIISIVAFLLRKMMPGTSQVMLAVKYLLSAACTVTICECIYQALKKYCPDFLSFICGNRRKIR